MSPVPTIMWDVPVFTNPTLQQTKREDFPTDIAIPDDSNINKKQNEKLSTYKT
jgi:hypothetical protein